MIFQFGRYKIDVDIKKTQEFYNSRYAAILSDVCDCRFCQNFSRAILNASDDFLTFLKKLGVDPRKPCEVLSDENAKQDICYSGWYHVCGDLLEGKIDSGCYDSSNCTCFGCDSGVRVWFEDNIEKMEPIEDGVPTPVLELSFCITLPICI